MRFTRREAIAFGGSGLATALAGCQESSSGESSPLHLKIVNHTPDPQEIEVEVVDPSEDDASEALVYSTTDAARRVVEIAAGTEGDEDSFTARTFEDIAELRSYTVYARLPQSGPDRWRHFHYVPPEDREYYQIFIRIYQRDDSQGSYVQFDNL
ncbi:hypothetical protein GCM10028857_03900 [Salinarchaeum chitinilyticum]